MKISSYLRSLRKEGIHFRIVEGRLKCEAPKDLLTPERLSDIQNRKSEIIAFLSRVDLIENNAIPPIEVISREGDLPLSFAQQRAWFLEQLQPGCPMHNLPGGWWLRGPLNVKALRATFTEIIRRHEVLRSSFGEDDGRPKISIAPVSEFDISVEDLRVIPESERKAELMARIEGEIEKPFDIEKGPLLLARLYRTRDEEYALYFMKHHIIWDAWSVDIFMKELSEIYPAFAAGKPSPLADLPFQYADYGAWENKLLSGDTLSGDFDYWRNQLSGNLPVLEIPTDFLRPLAVTYYGTSDVIELPDVMLSGLRTLGRQEQSTLYMVVLAAIKILLCRYANQREVIVGCPIENTILPEIEPLIGFFVNMLVLRSRVDFRLSFRDFLRSVRKTCLDAFSHQSLPFEKIVNDLNLTRDASRTPIFQAIFLYQDATSRPASMGDVKLEQFNVPMGSSQTDVHFWLKQQRNVWMLGIDYSTDLFKAETVRRMLIHLRTLLEDVAHSPDKLIGQIDIMPKSESRQLLVSWNNTETDYPIDVCLHELFEAQAERTPNSVAVEIEDKMITYDKLNRRANKLAHHLQMLGVVPGTFVGIYAERSIEMVVGLMGILKSGGAYVPLDPNYPHDRLAFMLDDSQVPVLVTAGKELENLPEYAGKVVSINRDKGINNIESDVNLDSGVKPDNPAYVIYTSGSTGKPKGVVGLHRGAINRFNWMWRLYPFDENEICCQKTSLSFVDFVWELFGPLLQGIKTVIFPDDIVQDPIQLAQSLAANHVTRIHLVPSLLRAVLEASDNLQDQLSGLKIWITSGEEISADLAQRFREIMPHAKLINLYGSSEVSADVTCYEINDGMSNRRVPIGRPIDNTHVYILNSDLQPVPVGVHGELYVGGAGLAQGYLNRQNLTNKSFIDHPFREVGRLYKTGDLARYLLDGNIEYLGRIDHQIKIHGFRIELGEIETVLREHPAVHQAVVNAVNNGTAGPRLVAYIVFKRGEYLTVSEVRRYLRQQVPDYMVPGLVVEMDALPFTPNGKIDRKALPDPLEAGRPGSEFVPPKTSLENFVAGVWQNLLKVERVGRHDNFYELGGHSLLSIRVVAAIEKETGHRLNPRLMFFQTLEQISASVNSAMEAGS